MDLLRNFLINAIFIFKSFIKTLTHKPDYKIIDRQLEYWVDHGKDYVTSNDFWESETTNWDEHIDSYVTTFGPEGIPPPPSVVTKMIIRIKYWYNNQIYKYISYDPNYKWPPEKKKCLRFHIPLSSAYLLDSNDTPIKDLLGKIKRYRGPHCDFYNQNIKISDMFYYDEDTLKTSFPKILLKNILGSSKTVSTSDGYIKDLSVP